MYFLIIVTKEVGRIVSRKNEPLFFIYFRLLITFNNKIDSKPLMLKSKQYATAQVICKS